MLMQLLALCYPSTSSRAGLSAVPPNSFKKPAGCLRSALHRVLYLLPRKPKTRHRNPLNANALHRLFCQTAGSPTG